MDNFISKIIAFHAAIAGLIIVLSNAGIIPMWIADLFSVEGTELFTNAVMAIGDAIGAAILFYQFARLRFSARGEVQALNNAQKIGYYVNPFKL